MSTTTSRMSRRPRPPVAQAMLAALGLAPSCALAAPGALDPAFGPGGAAFADFSAGNDAGNAIALQSDGKILVAGETTSGSWDFGIARFLDNGQLDPGFGTNGVTNANVGLFDAAVGVTELADGRIVVGGSGLLTEGGGNRDYAIARFLPDGMPDSSFGSDGMVTVDIAGVGFNDHAHAMLVQPDGAILLAGSGDGPIDEPAGFAIIRVTPAGVLDDTFGTGGITRTEIGTRGSGEVRSLALQADGSIIAAGDATFDNVHVSCVVRYDANGSVDSSFGDSGLIRTQYAAETGGVLVQPDGKFLLALTNQQNFVVVRLQANGLADPGFGTGGAFGVDFGGIDTCHAMTVDAAGKVILAGSSESGSRKSIALARLTDTGAFDPTFSGVGALLTPVGASGDAEAMDVVVQPDGKIVVAGTYGIGNARDFIVLRYEGDPGPPRDLAAWREFHFGSPDNSGDGADTFDFDRDGIPNLVEFALGLDPTRDSSGRLPAPLLANGRLVLSFADPGVRGVTYAAEWSPSLGDDSWNGVPDTAGPSGQHHFAATAAGQATVLMRLVVEPAPSP